jgi:glycosyltransferase involved in cell wall biosynthesis
MGVAACMHFPGFVSNEVLQKHYHECDLFVMPSAAEGFGFVFLEAMRYGKAIIAANSGGAPEVVTDGVTGTLVEYGNKAQLAQALINLCLDPNKCRRMGAAGRQRLQNNFTFRHFKEKLCEILTQELQSRCPAKIAIRTSEETPQVP